MKKKWPKNGDTVFLEDIAKPVVEAIKDYYRIEVIKPGAGIEWHGLEYGTTEKADGCSPGKDLTAKALALGADQDRTPLDAIIRIAVVLGVEQGRRAARKEMVRSGIAISSIEHAMDMLREDLGIKPRRKRKSCRK